MAEQLDTGQGWCCDGRTWSEHYHQSGECCQSQGKTIEQLPSEGQREARERLGQSG